MNITLNIVMMKVWPYMLYQYLRTRAHAQGHARSEQEYLAGCEEADLKTTIRHTVLRSDVLANVDRVAIQTNGRTEEFTSIHPLRQSYHRYRLLRARCLLPHHHYLLLMLWPKLRPEVESMRLWLLLLLVLLC